MQESVVDTLVSELSAQGHVCGQKSTSGGGGINSRPSDAMRHLVNNSRPPLDDNHFVCEAEARFPRDDNVIEVPQGDTPVGTMALRRAGTDDRFITPVQQLVCSCAGAFITSTCSKYIGAFSLFT